ncbi:type III secretion system export apparatus subunit SctS [Limnobacter alexandrii]|jgi:type III secretion HrpO family protein|uniref:type III secretion system export apparatus subunit SctS n=1 Tax=Limnobacter alexandrii TaxID=2570352 RepID=UPI00110986EE|nr:type III secretion system export apparatus subunit SctS [Limnobacter alexandrii]
MIEGFITLFQKALILTALISMPSILAATLVGTLIAFVQAVLQLQEQTLPFALKLIVISVVLVVSAGWIGSEMFVFTEYIFDQIAVDRSK